MKWQPIETARAGRILLALDDGEVAIGEWAHGEWWEMEDGDKWAKDSVAFWMPLPEPPK